MEIQKTAIVGGGVIGLGWAARLYWRGLDVSVYDANPAACEQLDGWLGKARLAYRQLDLPLKEGRMTVCKSLAEAVAEADFIQENVPENLRLKHEVLQAIEADAPPAALIASSTSGFMPSELQAGMKHPERLLVAHPFNPVYLLPLVEVVGSEQNDAATIERACSFFSSQLLMFPLVIRKQIAGHVADRLLEAVWREALWLVNDDVATTAEIDQAIIYGFGLRWAQMGLFETYRLAGGRAGMRHFIQQFGPALKWEWTKLMNVPELTSELVEKIASQSDAQSGHLSIEQLEAKRDQNIIGFLQTLKKNRWGAGHYISEKAAPSQPKVYDYERQPMRLLETSVKFSDVDYNQHLTENAYLRLASDATDEFLNAIGMDSAYLSQGMSVYTVETHLRHLKEAPLDADIAVEIQLLGFDEKRIWLTHTIYSGDSLLCTTEQMLLHVNTRLSKACPFEEPLKSKLALIASNSRHLPIPPYAGKAITPLAN